VAVPVLASVGTYLTGATSTSANFAVPAGVAANDIIVVVMYDQDISGPPGRPSGFVQLDRPIASNFQTDISWKRATGADTGTYNFTLASQWREGCALRITGCPTTGNPFEVFASDINAASTATPAVAVTTTQFDESLLWVGGSFDVGAWVQPSGFTESVDTGGAIGIAWLNWAIPAATGPITGTQTSSSHTGSLISFISATAPSLDQSAYRFGIDD
jgi:hypothetical protein